MNTTKTPAFPAGSSAGSRRRAGRFKAAAIRVTTAVLIVLIAGGAAAWYFLRNPAQANSQAGSTTTTVMVERGDITLTASGSGTLVTNQAVNMSFSTGGKVAELHVKLGDMVKTGDVLARLEKAQDLEANLASAQANLLQAQQSLAALQKSAGSTLAKAYQELVTAQAGYDEALNDSQGMSSTRCSPEILNKYRTNLNQISQKLYGLYESAPGSAETTIARYDYDTTLANYLYCIAYTDTEKLNAQSQLEIAKAELVEAEDQYNTLKEASGIDPDTLSIHETKVETAQAQVTDAQEALDGITLRAAIDGKITYLAAAAGTIVDTATFLTISDVSSPVVTVTLDETDMDKLVEGNAAEVRFTALPGQTFAGTVSLASPEMVSFGPFRAASGQVEVEAEAAKALETLPLGLSATIKITGKEAQDVLVVPVTALKQQKNGGYVVNLVGSDGQVQQQAVTVGLQDSTSAEITSGLKEGDIISFTTSSASQPNSDRQGSGMFFEGGGMPPIR